MSQWLFPLVVILASVLLLQLLLRALLGWVRRKMAGVVEARLRGRQVLRQELAANFFGLESAGRGQMRGNGALVLTPEELIFVMAFPRREVTVALARISTVSLARSHLGKTVFRELLKVEFSGPSGPDSVAWAVPEPAAWQRAVQAALPSGI